jgi:hypothetical protein
MRRPGMTTEVKIQEGILGFQKNEVTERYIYKRPAKRAGSEGNQRVLKAIAEDA